MPGRRATMKDVARASGVSAATVSFVLNDSTEQSIAPATRARVKRAAAELGYVPHGVARALREGSSRIVVLNVARLPHGGTSLSGFIDGLDDELERLGHTLLVRYSERPRGMEALVQAIAPRAVIDLDRFYFGAETDATSETETETETDAATDAVVDTSTEDGAVPHGAADAARDSGIGDADGGWVNGLAAHTAVQIGYLAERGHRWIGMALSADPRLARLTEIRSGYAATAASDAGLPAVASLALHGTAEGDRTALADFLARHPETTAIAGTDDESALRVLGAAARLGIAVPKELAVIGFDDTAAGELFSPALTSVRIDSAAFGRRAARTVLGREPGTEVPGPARVIRRESA